MQRARPVIALISAFLVPVAFAAPPNTIDLDKPGALEQLKLSHPQQYQAVSAVLRASERMPCKSGEMEALRVRFDIRDWECNLIVLTSWPAKRHVNFEFDGTGYAATVVLKDTEDFKVRSAITPEPGAEGKH
jgi:hypothetical protein